MRILIACCSFKDTFTAPDICTRIDNILYADHETIVFPMADGGENTRDVLRAHGKAYGLIPVHEVIDALGNPKSVSYILLDKTTAFIGASDILHLPPEQHELKDPRNLTSYGLGQLMRHAARRGCDHIYLGLGGTSTADCGVGMAAALLRTKLPKITALCDADISVAQMQIPLLQKCKDGTYQEVWEEIKANTTELSMHKPFYGAAGGMLLNLPNATPTLGSKFLARILGLEEKVRWADLVITGEGTIDNTFQGKGPSAVLDLARKHNKKVLYLASNATPSSKLLKSHGVTASLSLRPPHNLNNYAAQMRHCIANTQYELNTHLKDIVCAA